MNQTCDHLDRTRDLLLEWLRAPHRERDFLAGVSPAEMSRQHAAIAHRFLHWTRDSGFHYEVVETGSDGKPAYEVHWTHRGSSFVGFRQPPPQDTSDDALLVGCAALLENHWCRERLPR
jgi:hypothetical protein